MRSSQMSEKVNFSHYIKRGGLWRKKCLTDFPASIGNKESTDIMGNLTEREHILIRVSDDSEIKDDNSEDIQGLMG